MIDRCRSQIWQSVAQTILAGDAAAAADQLETMDRLNEAAYCRLRAGGEHAHGALRFYDSVGATRYVREARGGLDASA